MPEDALSAIESHLQSAEEFSDDPEVQYHVNSARQLLVVALERSKAPEEGDFAPPVAEE
jgi:hypothetical protein